MKREEDVKRLKTWKEEKERRALADSSSLIDPAPSEPVVLPSSTSSRSIQLQPVGPDAKRLPPLQTIESRSLLSRLTYQQTPAGTVYHDPVRVALSVEEASMTRPVFTKADYLSELFTRDHEKVPGYLEQFPVLLKRNHYVLQHHYATAKHFDLRIQLDGFTVSFAIPKGLSNWDGRKRLAIMTTLHPLAYSLFEGGSDGVTGCWDIGSYKYIQTEASKNPSLEHDNQPDTDDEEQDEDVNQEDKFGHMLYRSLFGSLPPYYSRQGKSFSKVSLNPNGTSRARGFTIELTGKRYQGLRLSFLRGHDDYKLGTPKGASEPTVRTHFMISRSSITSEVKGDTSILSNRTMDQIGIDSNCYAREGRGGIGQWEKQKLRGCGGEMIDIRTFSPIEQRGKQD